MIDLRSLATSVSAVVTTASVLLLAGVARSDANSERRIESIAAQVGSEIVLSSEVIELAAPVEERMRQAGAPPSEVAVVRKDALERLIENKLLNSVVERLELGADREEIDEAIAAIAADNEISVEQLLRSIQSHGLSVDEYRTKIQGEIERSKVVNAMVRSRIQVSEDELKALYDERFGKQRSGGEEVYLRHILITKDGTQANSIEAACRLAEDSRAQIVSGELEFAAVAQRVSDMNPERGGDLGWIHQEELASWMFDTIENLEPGEISPVVEMPFGCNLLQLVERRPFTPISYEQAKMQLQNIVFQRKTEIEYVKWLDVLRSQTYIERKAEFGG